MSIHRVLVVDPDRASRESLLAAARALGLRAQEAPGLKQLRERLSSAPPDLLLVDAGQDEIGSEDLLDSIRAQHPELAIVRLREEREEEDDADGEVLHKPCSPERLARLLERLEREARLRRENEYLRQELLGATENGWIARSAAMAEALRSASRSARSRGAVLLTGEPGSGRRRLARFVHYHSQRAGRPIVRLACGELEEDELAARLFGDAPDLWSGASLLEIADGGTLLLEEVHELPRALQERLSVVLAEGRLHAHARPIALDLRVIATSRRELGPLVASGALAENFHRLLCELPIRVPALRERGEDVAPLAQHLATSVARELGRASMRIAPAAEERLLAWSWPGNVRELECVVSRAAILARGDEIGPGEIVLGSNERSSFASAPEPDDLARRLANLKIADIERMAILATLESTHGNKTEAARRLGLTARTLSNKLKLWRSQGLVV